MTTFTPPIRALVLLLILAPVIASTPLSSARAQEPDFAAHYTSVDGRLTVDYPEDWLVHADVPGVVILANSAHALAAAIGTTDFPADGAVIGLVMPRAGISPASVLTGFRMQQELTGSEVLDFDTWWNDYAEPATLAGYPAERVETGSERTAGVLLSVDFGWASLLVTGDWARDSDHASTVAAILETIRYTARGEALYYTTPDGSLSFTYAGDWHVSHGNGGTAVWQNPSGSGNVALWFPKPVWNDYSNEKQDALGIAQDLMEAHYVSSGGDTAGPVSQFATAEIDDPREVRINGVDGVQIDYRWPEGAGYVLALDFDGRVLAAIVTIYDGSVNDYADALDMVLESLRFLAYSDANELATARQLWLDSTIDTYRVSVHFRDAIWADRIHTVTVVDGVVVGHDVECLLPHRRERCLPAAFDPHAYTIGGLFFQAAYFRSTVTLNEDYYYPERIGRGDPDVADSDTSWEVIDFVVLE